MNIDDLKAFVWVAKSGGFSRASAEQRVAQSALSRRVARLESDLGVALVQRDGRGIRLTEQGALLNEKSESIFAEIELVKTQMFEYSDEPRGEVTLALPPTTAQVLAPLIAMEVSEKYPEVCLKVWEGFSGTIHDWVVNGIVDIALLYEPEERSDISITPLIQEPIYLVAPTEKRGMFPILDRKETIRFSDLPKIPLILPRKSHSIRSLIDRQTAERRLKLDLAFEVDGIRATKAMVVAGLGCTLFSYAGVYEEVTEGSLEIIETMPRLSWTLSLGEPRHHDSSRAVRVVKSVVLQKLRALRSGGFWKGRFLFRDHPPS
jgi:LysR family nitrogen assimilation transcriptional regulator